MRLSRRSALGSVLVGLGMLTAGCAPFAQQGKLPSTDWVDDRLDTLIDNTGRDHFRRLSIQDGSLTAEVLMTDSVVRHFEHFTDQDGWQESRSPDVLDPDLDPATAVPVARFRLDLIPQWEQQLLPEEDGLIFTVDEVGLIQLRTSRPGESAGLLLDGSGRVPVLSDDAGPDVVRAIEEIVGLYGNRAHQVGGFNDFVHVDLNVEGSGMGMRVIRYPATAPLATVTDARFAEKTIFDPLTIDPALPSNTATRSRRGPSCRARPGIGDSPGRPAAVRRRCRTASGWTVRNSASGSTGPARSSPSRRATVLLARTGARSDLAGHRPLRIPPVGPVPGSAPRRIPGQQPGFAITLVVRRHPARGDRPVVARTNGGCMSEESFGGGDERAEQYGTADSRAEDLSGGGDSGDPGEQGGDSGDYGSDDSGGGDSGGSYSGGGDAGGYGGDDSGGDDSESGDSGGYHG